MSYISSTSTRDQSRHSKDPSLSFDDINELLKNIRKFQVEWKKGIKSRDELSNEYFSKIEYENESLQNLFDLLKYKTQYIDLKNKWKDLRTVDFDELYSSVYYALKPLNIDFQMFLTVMNKKLRYIMTDVYLEKFFRRIQRYYKEQINFSAPLTIEQVELVKRIYKSEIYVTGVCWSTIDNLYLRSYFYFTLNQPTIDNLPTYPDFTQNRPLTHLDFNEYLLRKLPLKTLVEFYIDKKLLCGYDEIEDIILSKIQTIDKIYTLDINFNTLSYKDKKDLNKIVQSLHTSKQQELKTFLESFSYDKFEEPLDLINILKFFRTLINSREFKDKVQKEIAKINEELKCMEYFIKLNQAYLDHKEFSKDKLNEFLILLKEMNVRQQCLCKQVFNGIIYSYNKPSYESHLIDIAKVLISHIQYSCYQFFGSSTTSCYHETFTPYIMKKWMDVVCHLLKITFPFDFNSPKCDYKDIIKINSSPIIYPKQPYCEGCHRDYKAIQEQEVNVSKNDQFPVKFAAMIIKGKLLLYRMKFTDNCDLDIDDENDTTLSNHFDQILKVSNSLTNTLEEVLFEIQKEQLEIAKMLTDT